MFKVNKFELTTLNGLKKRLKGILIRNGYFWYRDVNFLKNQNRGCYGRDHVVVKFYNYLYNQCLSPLML